jgi:Tol biopolymer transport system component
MRLPVVPLLIAASILMVVFYLFNSGGSDRRILDAPRITDLADIDGVETEVALAPDGVRCAVVADGDLWMLNLTDGHAQRLTETTEPETAPSWSPDGKRLTFSRGADTFVIGADPKDGNPAETFKTNATHLSWSPTGRLAFVRDRGLWLTDVGRRNDKMIVAPDENPNVTIHSLRFSPDSLQLAFIKSLLGISGQVWTSDVLGGTARALVADRPKENPLDVGWIMDGRQLVYLTDRSGGYSIWHVNFTDNTILPLTQPLLDHPLSPIGMAVWKDRIVLPRHFLTSDIVLSDGKTVVKSEGVATDPAASPDGMQVAYTVLKGNNSDIWTANSDGSHPVFRTGGEQARFATDGFHLVYTHADLNGNDDIWRMDLRNGDSERITDADELDMTPDTSPDGRWIAFSSTRSVAPSVWIIPASGGKRLRIGDDGYGPRFSPDSQSILFWNKGRFWTMDLSGSHRQPASKDAAPRPATGAWLKSAALEVFGDEIRRPDGVALFRSDRPIWPVFDVMPDGRFLFAPINIQTTGLWAIDLQFKTQ